MEGASLTDAVNALWEDFGLAGLDSIGIEGDEALIIWEQQLKKPKPLKTFLKGLDSSRQKAQQKAKFPYRIGVLPGSVGAIHDLILTGLLEGQVLLKEKQLRGMMISIPLLQVGRGCVQRIALLVKNGILNPSHATGVARGWKRPKFCLKQERICFNPTMPIIQNLLMPCTLSILQRVRMSRFQINLMLDSSLPRDLRRLLFQCHTHISWFNSSSNTDIDRNCHVT